MQLINILTLGNPEGVGVFFPEGLLGAITKPTGYNASSAGNQAYPSQLARQPPDIVTTQVRLVLARQNRTQRRCHACLRCHARSQAAHAARHPENSC